MQSNIRIGTRESELAVWQATLVKDMLADRGFKSELVYIKSEGDVDLKTPLYEMGVQGIFTRSLDIALINNSIDIAVHSMKDVPTQLPTGIVQAAVLERGNYKDLFVVNNSFVETSAPIVVGSENSSIGFLKSLEDPLDISDEEFVEAFATSQLTIATSSIRRKAQWLHRYPKHIIENLRGNINTRMKKVAESTWAGAIFAAAGLERIKLRPADAIELDWMLPAPAQGAIMVVCRRDDEHSIKATAKLDHKETAMCTAIEKDFLRALLGGCSTPISALAVMDKKDIWFRGSILTTDGKQKIEVEQYVKKDHVKGFGEKMAIELLNNGGKEIADTIRNGK